MQGVFPPLTIQSLPEEVPMLSLPLLLFCLRFSTLGPELYNLRAPSPLFLITHAHVWVECEQS